jgi:hypothetical protein
MEGLRQPPLACSRGSIRTEPVDSGGQPDGIAWRFPMKIRRNQLCPIHRSRTCCGRELVRKEKVVQVGVRRIEDRHHPRGYRELRSPAEMRKLLNRKIVEQDGICVICHFEFKDCTDVVPDHENPKGMGGAWRDDHPSYVRAVHWWCTEKRSRRMDE